MADVPTQFRGTMYFLASKSAQQVFFDGVSWRSDVGIGGGPVLPPEGGGGGNGKPDHIWGPTDPRPTPPIANVPGIPNPNPPNWGAHPEHPIVIPPPQLPPDVQPPQPPQPGDPTTVIPGNYPVAPIVPASFLVVNWPGIGLVKVAPPVQTSPS